MYTYLQTFYMFKLNNMLILKNPLVLVEILYMFEKQYLIWCHLQYLERTLIIWKGSILRTS